MKKVLGALLGLLTLVSQAPAKMVNIPFTNWSGQSEQLETRIGKPAGASTTEKRPAVVVLHHGGGWDAQTTQQYASLLNANGYITAEPVMFRSRLQPGHLHVPKVFATLRYLASLPDVDPNRIAVMGLSAGAFQTVYALTEWANQQYGQGHRFAAAVAFYPACWIIKKLIEDDMGKFRNTNFPGNFMHRFTGTPLTILAGGKDDYDNRKPNMCAEAVETMPDTRQKAMTKIHVFENATHGWDHGQTYSFFEALACEGRGCTNTNRNDPVTTEAGKAMLLNILKEQLRAP